MKIAEAKAKLMQLADGKYHSLEYKVDDHGNGSVSQVCKVYVSGHGYFESGHWDSTLRILEDAIGGRPAISEDIPLSSQAANITNSI